MSHKGQYGLSDHCQFLYFRQKLEEVVEKQASKHFVTETDPNTYLASMSRGYTFRDMLSDSTAVPAAYCSLLQFGALMAATRTATPEQILAAVQRIRKIYSASDEPSANPALQLAAFLASAVTSHRRYLAFLVSRSLIDYPRRIWHIVGGSLTRGEPALIPIMGALPFVSGALANDGAYVVLRYAGDYDPQLEEAVTELRSRNEPFVQIEIDRPFHLMSETFKWEAATIFACASLGIDPFDLSRNRVPRAFALEMLEQLTRGQNPLQRSARITDRLIQLYADGIARQEISSLSLTEAVRSFFRILTPGRHVSLLVDMNRTEEVHCKFITLRNMLSTVLNRPVWMAFGPYSEGYSGYFFRDSLPDGPCIIFTTDPQMDKAIPGADYTFGQLHQIMALSEYDTLVHWHRPVIRLHLSPDLSVALDQLLHTFGKALRRLPA